MVRAESDMRSEERVAMGGGLGSVTVQHILEKDALRGHGRLFARNILKPGSSIGFHTHTGDFEIYYVTKGEGIFSDNGRMVPVKAGDVGVIDNHQGHSIENTGTGDMEVIAVVLYEQV